MANHNVGMSESKMGIEAPMVVSQIAENCMYVGFFGRLDSERIKVVTDRILDVLDQSSDEHIIIDLSNIDLIDSAIAAHLAKIAATLKLTGITTIFCGINGVVAQTMVVLGIEFEKYTVVKDLQAALKALYKMSNLMLVPIVDKS